MNCFDRSRRFLSTAEGPTWRLYYVTRAAPSWRARNETLGLVLSHCSTSENPHVPEVAHLGVIGILSLSICETGSTVTPRKADCRLNGQPTWPGAENALFKNTGNIASRLGRVLPRDHTTCVALAVGGMSVRASTRLSTCSYGVGSRVQLVSTGPGCKPRLLWPIRQGRLNELNSLKQFPFTRSSGVWMSAIFTTTVTS